VHINDGTLKRIVLKHLIGLSPNVGAKTGVIMTKPSGNKIGRPPKSDIVERKESRGVGRPKGDAAIINEYKLRMLNSPKSAKVLEAIYDAALNDEHKNQAAAWKLIVDRIVPVSVFEEQKANGGMPQISINISGLNEPKVSSGDDVIDV
jgi:hypothetical protein